MDGHGTRSAIGGGRRSAERMNDRTVHTLSSRTPYSTARTSEHTDTMFEPIVLVLFLVIVLAAVYFYLQRRKQQGAFGGDVTRAQSESADDRPQS